MISQRKAGFVIIASLLLLASMFRAWKLTSVVKLEAESSPVQSYAKSCCYSIIPCSADPHCFHHVFWLFCVPDFFPQIIHSARFLFFFLKAPKEVLQEFAEKVEKKKSVAEDKKRKSQLIDDLIEIDDEDGGGAMMLSRKPMKGPGDRDIRVSSVHILLREEAAHATIYTGTQAAADVFIIIVFIFLVLLVYQKTL